MRAVQLGLDLSDPRTLARVRETALPKAVQGVFVPPIKSQGIKTKLIPFIFESIRWDGCGRWVEPFLGSGVVLFNLAPPRAYVADANLHVIQFYRDLSSGQVDENVVRDYLECEGRTLAERGDEYYYEVRHRFNARPNSLDFLFLNRSCFNGIIRFNRRGEFNVPFVRKADRFRRALVTKIANQVAEARRLMRDREWVFEVADWRDTLSQVRSDDFVYADPPYIGRHTDYFNKWTEHDALSLLSWLRSLPCGFALSTWKENKYRRNAHLDLAMSDVVIKTTKHFYHVGATEALRNEMVEALVIKEGFASVQTRTSAQHDDRAHTRPHPRH